MGLTAQESPALPAAHGDYNNVTGAGVATVNPDISSLLVSRTMNMPPLMTS